ncbi:hypothetical protein G6F49_007255 [Rhizopus delemar]|nr:hypothetical protein G6F49_007255 [Rhizopus delemar]KAG1582288.1 hypothetical protein G6F48_009257 [Rhizopus delemar]
MPAIKHYLGFTVPSIEVEEDHSNNNGSDDGYHFDVDNPSQLEPSSPSSEADYTYQTEDSNHYTEAYTMTPN